MPHTEETLDLLRRLVPMENGVTVFDADTQETSYGIWLFGGLPFIFDTHRKDDAFVATIELLTELVTPLRITRTRINRLCDACRALDLLAIPYTGCFFKGNLHVYSFSGPVRGFDIAAAGPSVSAVEQTLSERVGKLWPKVPQELVRAQRELLAGTRTARHMEDLEVLLKHRTEKTPTP